MQLTKTQVITLFLATTKAVAPDATAATIINANCSEDTVAAGTPASALTTCSSNTTCTTDADCSTANEVCGSWVQTDVAQADIASYCVHNDACNNLGKLGGSAWTIHCGNADITAVDADTLPVPATLLANVEATITPAETTWTDVQNLKIMAWDNFQTGWWIRDEEESETLGFGIWAETDKPVNNLCEDTGDCEASECCANWPDNNNKRCINSDLGGVVQTLLPFSNFTPTCIAEVVDEAPTPAFQDLAEEALANAAQELDQFASLVVTTLKEAAGYDDMTEEEQAAFDAELEAATAEDDAKTEANKEMAGYADFTTKQQTIYEAELLAWGQEVWEICQADENAIECDKAWDLRNSAEAMRKNDGYYAMNDEERTAWDETYAETAAAEKATLTAAAANSWAPVAGEPGSACSATARCSDRSHCCGTATPAAGSPSGVSELTGVCASKTTGTLINDKIGITYTHVCGAKALLATVSTFLAATYLM